MSEDLLDVHHLTVDMVTEIHGEAIARFGGGLGVRDLPLLESAVAAPKATFDGTSPYKDLVEIGAAYLYFLSRNHPFVDGNKRTALAACLVFLRINGIDTASDDSSFEQLAMDIASSALNREETTQRLRAILTGQQ